MATLTSFSSFGMAILIFFQTLLAPLGISLNFGGVYNSKDKYAYDFAYSTEKIMQYDKLGKDSEASVYLAKDEREGCQFVLRARKANARNTVVTVSDFVSDNGEVLPHETFVVKYVNTSKSALQQSYPDPVVPYEGESIKIYSTESTAFYIELRSSPNTPAGVYRASVTVTDTSSGNTELANIPITATVWNFTLPKTPSCKTMMGLMCGLDSPEIFYSLNGVDINDPEQQNEALEVYKEYYEFMLDRKVSPYMLPYDITDPRADSYLNDPRMTSFTIPVLDENNIESKVKAYHDKLSKNPEWASKSFYYPVDEPVSGEQYLKFYDNVDKIRAICGNDCNIYTPFYKETIWYNGISYNALDLLDGKSDMICPITSLFSDPSFCNKFAGMVANGVEPWWYVCLNPKDNYCNMFITNTGLQHRILFWQQYDNDIAGFQYWSATYWNKNGNPWYHKVKDSNGDFGDGYLLYPKMQGGYGPASSLRFNAITDGIEDYEYLTIAQKVLGEAKTDEIINSVTTSLTEYITDDTLFCEIRVRLGNEIQNAV